MESDRVMDRDFFKKSLEWAEELIEKEAVSDDFIIATIKQFRRRFEEGKDCKGCYRQMEFIVEKLETGSFPWEKEIEKIKIDISSLQEHLKKIKDKNG